MNNKTTFSEVFAAFVKYLHEPKTIFDFKDRIKALLLLAVIAGMVYLLVHYLYY